MADRYTINRDITLSVVICTYNRDAYILSALNSLVNQTLARDCFEVVLVNNNSTDSTASLCEHFAENLPDFRYRYFLEINQGLSYARNRGINESVGTVIVFMDDDAVAEPDYLQNLHDFFVQYPDAAACGGRIYPDFETRRPRWMSHFLVPLTSSLDMGDKVRLFKQRSYPIGANMAFKRPIFDRFGVFNIALGRKGANLVGAEEKDFFYRIMSEGLKVYYVPDAIVHHHVPDSRLTFSFFKKQAIGIGYSERLRAKALSGREYGMSVFRELLKWGASLALSLFYLLTIRLPKAWRLLVFRWYVSKGLLGCYRNA